MELQYLDKLFDLIEKHVKDHNTWDYSSCPPDVYQIRCDNGEVFSNDTDMVKKAIEAKRNGLYDKSIYYYYFLLDAQDKEFGKISVVTLRNCVKTLIAANDFADAYQYLYAMSANIFKAKNFGLSVPDGIDQCITDDTTRMIYSSITAANGDLSAIEQYCEDVSGSTQYKFPCSRAEIVSQIETVRGFIKDSVGI